MLDPTIIAIPLFLASMAAEAWYSRKNQRNLYADKRDTATSLLMGIGSIPSGMLIGSATIYASLWVYEYRLWQLPQMPIAVYAFIALLLQDFCYYWNHRAGHRVRALWAAHVNHHSSEQYNLSTALRQTWTGFFSFIFYFPMLLAGFPISAIALAAGFNLIYQFWIHTQAINKMPRWFETIFNTPSHHRVHHGSNPQYIDKNYGGILIIWDRLFGTFQPEVEQVRYGLTNNIKSYNLLLVSFHHWIGMLRDMRRTKGMAKFAIPLMPPDWLILREDKRQQAGSADSAAIN
jgi:sterol desaturase/sphingolipid hydroxylase (fatty acid hydroxylase superfamily)